MVKNFKEQEFTCKCGCGINNMDSVFTSKLDDARDIAGTPFILNRGCSCIKHNKKVGGSDTSSHIATEIIKCTAADIKCTSSRKRFLILQALIKVGFTRIGISKYFIHVDGDTSKSSKVTWLY